MGARVTYAGQQALASGALTLVTNVAATGRTGAVVVANVRRLIQATLKAASAISQTVQVVFNSAKGTAYDTVLVTATLVGDTDFAYVPDGAIVLGPGDNLTLTCTNTGTPAVTVSGLILCEE